MLLKGVRVLEWTAGSITAAFCARLLADLGAEVVKIEEPGGDPLRRTAPLLTLADGRREGALFCYLNSGKRSLAIAEGPRNLPVLRRLAENFDLLVLAAPVEPALAPTIAEIRADRPKLVVLEISPFGREHAAGDVASFASDMVMQHRGGFAYEHARPVEDPNAQPPIAGADREAPLAAGVAAACAAVAGLLAAKRRSGAAPLIDFAKLDFVAHLCMDAFCASQRGETDFRRKRRSEAGIEVAGGLIWLIRCADGWAAISPREQHQWDRWMELIGEPDWSRDQALCGTKQARRLNSRRIQRLLSQWSETRSKADVFAMAQAARVACFPVSTPSDLLRNEQLRHRQLFDEIAAGDGPVRVPGLPFGLTTSAGETMPRGRTLGIPALGDAGSSDRA